MKITSNKKHSFSNEILGDIVLDSSTNPPVTLPLVENASFRFHLPSGFNTWNDEIV